MPTNFESQFKINLVFGDYDDIGVGCVAYIYNQETGESRQFTAYEVASNFLTARNLACSQAAAQAYLWILMNE